jgi:hypothetical protein
MLFYDLTIFVDLSNSGSSECHGGNAKDIALWVIRPGDRAHPQLCIGSEDRKGTARLTDEVLVPT